MGRELAPSSTYLALSRKGTAISHLHRQSGGCLAVLTSLVRCFQDDARAFENVRRRDCSHAAMIDRAVAQHTRRAIRRLAQNLSIWRKRPRRQWIRRTEDNQSGSPESGRNVRGSGIVSYQKIDLTEDGDQLRKISLPG